MSRSAAMMVLLPRLTAFAEAYPDIVLDVVTVTGPVDLVAGSSTPVFNSASTFKRI